MNFGPKCQLKVGSLRKRRYEFAATVLVVRAPHTQIPQSYAASCDLSLLCGLPTFSLQLTGTRI